MGRRQNVLRIDEGAATNVHRLLRVLLQDGHLPGILAELAVTVDVRRILDATGDAVRVATAALAGLEVGHLLLLLLRSLRPAAAHLAGGALLLRPLLLLLVVGLTLWQWNSIVFLVLVCKGCP